MFNFFLRNNNDIDHIIPVAWKIAQSANEVHLIITTHPAYRRVYRLDYLSRNANIYIHHILDFLPIKATMRMQILREVIKNKTPNEINFPDVWNDCCVRFSLYENIIKSLFLNRNAIACFDWITTPFVCTFLKILKKLSIKCISLPHGITVFTNKLVGKDMINYASIEKKGEKNNLYDYVVVPNNYGKDRLIGTLPQEKIQVLGSARYCREWRHILSSATTLPPVNIANDAKLKVAFFLRDYGYDIFWEEVLRTYQLIIQFPGVHLIVKHHPRSVGQQHLMRLYPALFSLKAPNLTILSDEGSSVPLVEWADLIVDSGTSITIDGALRGKPVLCLEYLHPNRTVMAENIRNCDIQTRDQLYNWIEFFLENKQFEFYGEELQNLESLWINNYDVDVLGRYSSFLNNVAAGNILKF